MTTKEFRFVENISFRPLDIAAPGAVAAERADGLMASVNAITESIAEVDELAARKAAKPAGKPKGGAAAKAQAEALRRALKLNKQSAALVALMEVDNDETRSLSPVSAEYGGGARRYAFPVWRTHLTYAYPHARRFVEDERAVGSDALNALYTIEVQRRPRGGGGGAGGCHGVALLCDCARALCVSMTRAPRGRALCVSMTRAPRGRAGRRHP